MGRMPDSMNSRRWGIIAQSEIWWRDCARVVIVVFWSLSELEFCCGLFSFQYRVACDTMKELCFDHVPSWLIRVVSRDDMCRHRGLSRRLTDQLVMLVVKW
jgi:hypothetical protein